MGRTLQSASAIVIAIVVAVATFSLGGGAAQATTPSGEDGRIAFVRANQIYTMGPGGANVRQLTTSGKNYRPEWSPDGRRLSYIHEADGRRDVWVMSGIGGSKRAVTRSGDVTSAGATWSPDGRTFAYGAPIAQVGASVLMLVSATTQTAQPRVASGYGTGDGCGGGAAAYFLLHRYLAWSADAADSRIAVLTGDCQYDDAMSTYRPATGELRQQQATGADCCGYLEWTDLFFGPTGALGYSERDRGPTGEEPGPRRIVYPGFASLAGDTGGAPSPSGRFLAFSNDASGTSYVMRADADGTDRRRLAVGYQPDWSVKP